MDKITQPLREEHKELLPHIELILETANLDDQDELKERAEEVYLFLKEHLIPHAKAEEEVLYPAVEKAMGAHGATKTMSRDHVEVMKLTGELDALKVTHDIKSLKRVLYGLYALIKVHFAKEEEIYLPLLDEKMNQEDAELMFEEMEKAAATAKSNRQ